jgi:phosphoribosylpyrophosphate synthetase
MDLSDKKQFFNNNQKQNKMPDLNLTAEQKKLLDLKDDATPEVLGVVLTDLVDKAKRTDKAEKALADLKAETTTKAVTAILEQGMADKKLTKDLADKLRVTYTGNPAGLKDLVDAMQAQQIVSGAEGDAIPEKYKGRSFNDLYVSGDLADVKKNYPDYFQTLKKD